MGLFLLWPRMTVNRATLAALVDGVSNSLAGARSVNSTLPNLATFLM
jgi:hypothetical protein